MYMHVFPEVPRRLLQAERCMATRSSYEYIICFVCSLSILAQAIKACFRRDSFCKRPLMGKWNFSEKHQRWVCRGGQNKHNSASAGAPRKNPIVQERRHRRRIAVTLDTLLRKKLKFRPRVEFQNLHADPCPVHPETCLEYLERLCMQSEDDKSKRSDGRSDCDE